MVLIRYDEGTICTVSGWGTTTEGGSLARVLQKVNMIIMLFMLIVLVSMMLMSANVIMIEMIMVVIVLVIMLVIVMLMNAKVTMI